jgi:hypothetical protein
VPYRMPRASDSVVEKLIIRRIIAAISRPSLTAVNTSNTTTSVLIAVKKIFTA